MPRGTGASTPREPLSVGPFSGSRGARCRVDVAFLRGPETQDELDGREGRRRRGSKCSSPVTCMERLSLNDEVGDWKREAIERGFRASLFKPGGLLVRE